MTLAKPLADIPKGSIVFLDANILHFYLRGPERVRMTCTLLLERVEGKDVSGYTSTLVLDELMYKILLRMVEEKYQRNPLAILQGKPEEIGVHAREVRRAVNIVLGIAGLNILGVEKCHVEEAVDYMEKYSMLPRDAIHLSVMKSIGCKDLASADGDFDRVVDLNRWTPL